MRRNTTTTSTMIWTCNDRESYGLGKEKVGDKIMPSLFIYNLHFSFSATVFRGFYVQLKNTNTSV